MMKWVWLDYEMTGLSLEDDVIIEAACVVTDEHLSKVIEGPNLVVSQTEDRMSRMNEWCTEHHGQSGLTDSVLKSHLTNSDVENQLMEFIKSTVDVDVPTLCGNSIHIDRSFMKKCMPRLDHMFHYRMLDISVLKLLAQSWYPDLQPYEKKDKHRALEDILESIEELRYYREVLLKNEQ